MSSEGLKGVSYMVAFRAQVYTIWVHGPLGYAKPTTSQMWSEISSGRTHDLADVGCHWEGPPLVISRVIKNPRLACKDPNLSYKSGISRAPLIGSRWAYRKPQPKTDGNEGWAAGS